MVVSQTRNKLIRQRKVARLRLSGVTDQATIAQQLGVHQSTISRDFAELDVRFREHADQDIAAAKGIDLARLDAMIEALWPEAVNGNAKTWHVDRVLKCLERRAALLGLDAPAKRELSGTLEFRHYAEQVAEDLGLDAGSVIAEAERIVAGGGSA
jgi:hypothetical protein